MLLRQLPSVADAEDVAQEVLIRVLRSSRSMREDERFAAWLAVVVKNAVADQLRSRQRHPLLASADAPDQQATREEEPDGPGGAGLARVLRPFADRLSPTYRDAIVLSDFEDVPQAEIARRMGLSVSAIKSRTQRARQQLRKLLMDCCRIVLDARRSVVGCEPKAAAGCQAGDGAPETNSGCSRACGVPS
jgi:RNA polymerase sigma-70 factor (ECF subfamily)